MAKAPPDVPMVGDRAKLRGRDVEGIVFHIAEMGVGGKRSLWAAVRWTKGMGPRVVHLHELERLPIDSSVKSAL